MAKSHYIQDFLPSAGFQESIVESMELQEICENHTIDPKYQQHMKIRKQLHNFKKRRKIYEWFAAVKLYGDRLRTSKQQKKL